MVHPAGRELRRTTLSPAGPLTELRLGTTVVASGTFARRGNSRDPEQDGSECKAQS